MWGNIVAVNAFRNANTDSDAHGAAYFFFVKDEIISVESLGVVLIGSKCDYVVI